MTPRLPGTTWPCHSGKQVLLLRSKLSKLTIIIIIALDATGANPPELPQNLQVVSTQVCVSKPCKSRVSALSEAVRAANAGWVIMTEPGDAGLLWATAVKKILHLCTSDSV
jgi:hypothetical protein